MRKVLLYAHMSPFDNPGYNELAIINLIGDNIGNLLFASSVCRTVMTDDTQVDTIAQRDILNGPDLERINNEYECFLIPLANAFRVGYREKLDVLSDFIEKLKIPCVVVGVGVQAPIDYNDINRDFVFDENVKRFMDRVLDKSAIIGLRGERTAVYLEHLGYKRDKDFTVIGCPSMYWHGGELPRFEKNELTPNSNISVNCKIDLPKRLHEFMYKNIKLLNNFNYVPQILVEMHTLYTGKALPKKKYNTIPEYFLRHSEDCIYSNGKGIGFLNAKSWMEYLRQKEFSFGSRIHGNIAAIISGTPCYIIVSDSRIRELAEFHHIPHILYDELPDNATIFDLYDKADYSQMFKEHKEKFNHYRNFLNRNKVKHIFNETDVVANSAFDKKISEIDFNGPLTSFYDPPVFEKAKRISSYCSGKLKYGGKIW